MSQARILDGKLHAERVRASVRERCRILVELGLTPGLTVILVGDDPASQVYVRNKDRAAHDAGFHVQTVRLPATTTQRELLAVVSQLNSNASVHGILVQLPLPRHLDSDAVIRALDPAKDVDGLHPDNVAALVQGRSGLVPCTPAGCLELCDSLGYSLSGKHVVIVGRSQLVGKPFAQLALQRDATVTICHSKTVDLPAMCRQADVLVAAVGRAELVRGDWIRPGAVILDVGINRAADGRLVGDVAFTEAVRVAGALTPVPGGVGPMTIAMLLSNTLVAALRAHERCVGAAPASSQR